ncbi:MAG: hypothetical protein R3B45_08530 [Bdellovibrionota bacterium]
MAYQKIFVDNPHCSRRYHVTFDDKDEKLARVELKCAHCDSVIYEFRNHPKIKVVRDENLTKATALSPNLARKCYYQDKLPPKKHTEEQAQV